MGAVVDPIVPHADPEQPAPETDHNTPLPVSSFWSVAVKPALVPVRTVTVAGATLTEMIVTVKLTPLLGRPPTVTTTLPVVAPAGTVTLREVSVQSVTVAGTPPKETVLEPCAKPNPAPEIDICAPTDPEVLLRLEITGAGVTVNGTPLLATPASVTTTFPVVAPVGTDTEILVGVQARPEPTTTPLNETVPRVGPKFVPVIVTEVPTGPEVGERLVIFGAALAGVVTLETFEYGPVVFTVSTARTR